jgi:hypothetical protein
MKNIYLMLSVVLCFSACIPIPCEDQADPDQPSSEEPGQCLDCDFNCLLPCKSDCGKQPGTDVNSCYNQCRAQCCNGVANN